MTDELGFAYFHGTACLWSPTRGLIKHARCEAMRDARRQWGTSQYPSPIKPMLRSQAELYQGFFEISAPAPAYHYGQNNS